MKKLIMVLALAGLIVPATFAVQAAGQGQQTKTEKQTTKTKKKVSKPKKEKKKKDQGTTK